MNTSAFYDVLVIGGGGGGELVKQVEVIAQLIVLRIVTGGVVVHSDHIEDGVGGGLSPRHAGDVAGAAAGGAVLKGGLAPLEQAAGGDGVGLIIKRGEIVKKVPEDKILEELKREVEEF